MSTELNADDIKRSYATREVTITSVSAFLKSEVIDFRPYTGGYIELDSTWVVGDITFEVSDKADGLFRPFHDSTGALVTVIGVSGLVVYAISPAMFGASYVKIVSNVFQVSAKTVRVFLKG